MKWMIASDLHGSAYYCRKMLEAFEREGADRLFLLGDLLYHGPRNDLPREYAPKEVIPLLNGKKEKLLCVRGNCDAEVDQMVLEFPVLADYAVLPVGQRLIYATHGHIYCPFLRLCADLRCPSRIYMKIHFQKQDFLRISSPRKKIFLREDQGRFYPGTFH